jgi:hypothetical protein
MSDRPQGTVQAVSDLVSGLKSNPVLLMILLLNASMVAGAAWYLVSFEKFRHEERSKLFEIVQSCIGVKP